VILDDLKKEFSSKYSLVKITESILNDVFEIMKQNIYFISRTQPHDITMEECREDIYALPPNTDLSQKFYLAFYKDNECIGLLDYIEGYPTSDVVYLGLFILSPRYQGAGVGSNIISKFVNCVRKNGFKEIKLACFESNEVGHAFWKHMEFTEEKVSTRENDGRIYNLIHMHKVLN